MSKSHEDRKRLTGKSKRAGRVYAEQYRRQLITSLRLMRRSIRAKPILRQDSVRILGSGNLMTAAQLL